MFSQAQVADGSRPVAFAAGLVTLAFLTLFPCAGYAQSDVRELTLRFETLSDEALSSVEVVAGATTEIAVALENADLLGPDEAVSVSVTLTAVVQQLTLTEATPRVTLSIEAAVDTTAGGTVEAAGVVLSNDVPVANTRVEPATLAVEVLPRRFGLRFETPEGAVLEMAEVVVRSAMNTIEAAVALTNVEALEPGETVPVTLTAEGVDVDADTLVLSIDYARVALTIDTTNVAVGIAGSVTATGVVLSGNSAVENTSVGSATLAVEVVLRSFALRFETPEGAVLEMAQMVTGSTTEVTVVLTNAEALEPGETIPVMLTAEGMVVNVVPSMVTLAEATTRATLRIDAAATAMSGILTAEADIAGLMDVVVQPGMLSVTVVPPPVHLQLAFEPLTVAVGTTATVVLGFPGVSEGAAVTVSEGAAVTVVLSLPGVPEGAAVTVALDVADAATAQTTPVSVVFSSTAARHEVTVRGVAEGSVPLTASVGKDALVDSGLPPNSTVAPAQLAVTVVPPLVHLQLAFDPSSLTLVVGSSATVVLSLSGVPEGTTVTVTLSVADEETAEVTFTEANPNIVVTVTGTVAGSVTLTADMNGVFGLQEEVVRVASAQLAVTVVPEREFTLGFETLEGEALTEARVFAGGTTEVTVALTDAEVLEPGEAVSVTLTAQGVVVSSTATVVLSMDEPRMPLTIDATGVAAGIAGSVTATGVVLLNGATVAHTQVRMATLAVEVLPREFALRFETPEGEALTEAQVVAGSTTEVEVVLTGAEALEPNEEVPVTLTAEGVGVSTDTVVLSMTAPDAVLTIAAATTATSGTLTAEADIAGVMNAVVEPATLEVEVLPRRFALRFETPEGTVLERARVTAGSTTEVAVSLTGAGALEPGETVPVMLTAEGVGVSMDTVVLSMTMSQAMLTIDAAANATSGTLTAEADTAGVMNMVVEPATLAVEILPRRFALRFETPGGAVLETARVTAGSTTEVAVALTDAGALEPEETVSVTLTMEGVGVSTDTVVLSMVEPRMPLTINAAVDAMSGTLTAVANTAGVMNAVVEPATLSVEVLPRSFALRFETPERTVLETARVVAEGMTEVTVALTNVEALAPDETVSVTLTAQRVVVSSTDTVVLSVVKPRMSLTIDATGVAADTAGSVTATGVVLLNGATVAHTRVRMATLSVEVTAREAGLQLRMRVLLEGPLQ